MSINNETEKGVSSAESEGAGDEILEDLEEQVEKFFADKKKGKPSSDASEDLRREWLEFIEERNSTPFPYFVRGKVVMGRRPVPALDKDGIPKEEFGYAEKRVMSWAEMAEEVYRLHDVWYEESLGKLQKLLGKPFLQWAQSERENKKFKVRNAVEAVVLGLKAVVNWEQPREKSYEKLEESLKNLNKGLILFRGMHRAIGGIKKRIAEVEDEINIKRAREKVPDIIAESKTEPRTTGAADQLGALYRNLAPGTERHPYEPAKHYFLYYEPSPMVKKRAYEMLREYYELRRDAEALWDSFRDEVFPETDIFTGTPLSAQDFRELPQPPPADSPRRINLNSSNRERALQILRSVMASRIQADALLAVASVMVAEDFKNKNRKKSKKKIEDVKPKPYMLDRGFAKEIPDKKEGRETYEKTRRFIDKLVGVYSTMMLVETDHEKFPQAADEEKSYKKGLAAALPDGKKKTEVTIRDAKTGNIDRFPASPEIVALEEKINVLEGALEKNPSLAPTLESLLANGVITSPDYHFFKRRIPRYNLESRRRLVRTAREELSASKFSEEERDYINGILTSRDPKSGLVNGVVSGRVSASKFTPSLVEIIKG